MYADPLKYLSMRIPDLVSLSYPIKYRRGESSQIRPDMDFLHSSLTEYTQNKFLAGPSGPLKNVLISLMKFCPI